MTLPAQKFRELVFILLYVFETHNMLDSQEKIVDLCTFVSEELKVSKKYVQNAFIQAQKVHEHKEEIETMIHKVSKSYDLHRIQSVERTILKLALYELLIDQIVDKKIVFAEAKRLAKKFSTKESIAFVGSILDAAVQNAIAP